MKLRLISVATAISALLVVTPAVADKKDGHHKHDGKDSSVIVVRGDRDRVTRHSHKHRHGDRKHVHKHRHGPRYSHHRNGHGHKKGRHHRRDHVVKHKHWHRHPGGLKHSHKHKHGRNFSHHRDHVRHYSSHDHFDAEDFFAGMLLYGIIDGLDEH
ncbi:hypothetical protein [Solemya velum gill symbiont]|uniref:hypothetical protein n=1 Tax=Solemya velum gill symbiont TaxID=2340 RepID=UPI0005B99628|nr:hypothetical protein [Solemya velum gill symbiont]